MSLTVIGNVEVGDYLLLGTGPGGHWLIIKNERKDSDFNSVVAIRENPIFL